MTRRCLAHPIRVLQSANTQQYHVYLFETILLCCKDINLNKPKNKLKSTPLVDKRGKPKLQLKGRIFMQNVTDLVSLAKPGKKNSTASNADFGEMRIWSNRQVRTALIRLLLF